MMSHQFKAALGLLFLLNCFQVHAQNKLTVACWNIEWFGSTSNGPSNENLQEANVKTALRYLNADIYGLEEVVDTMRFRRVVDSLGSNYRFVIADFCSGNNTGNGASWLTGQKEAFIYNKNVLSNVRVRGLMRTSPTAFTNFASGRLPYLLNADVTLNGKTRNFNFIVIHGKSGSTSSDYDRRKEATQEFKDTLDASFGGQNTIIIGDYNDALDKTICTTCGTTLSSYDPLIKDSAHYKSITLPLAKAGQSTMISYPNVIDNHVASTEAFSYYIPNSVMIRTDITSVIPDFTTGNTTDHYPVTSSFTFEGVATAIPIVNAGSLLIKAFPNPFTDQLTLSFGKTLFHVQWTISDIQGRILYVRNLSKISGGSTLYPDIRSLARGVYFLSISTPELRTVVKLIKL